MKNADNVEREQDVTFVSQQVQETKNICTLQKMLMYQVSYSIMKMAGNTHTQYFMFATKVLLCIFIFANSE